MNRIVKGFYIVGLMVASIVALGMFIEFKSLESVIRKEMQTVNLLQRNYVAGEISSRLMSKTQIIADAAAFISGETDDERILRFLKKLLADNPSFASIYFGTPENTMINGSGWIPPKTFDLRTRPWYVKAVHENRSIFTEAFMNATKDRMIVTVAMPVFGSDNRLLGVVAGDIGIENILAIANDTRISENGYTVVIDAKGNVLAYPDFDGAAKPEPMKTAEISEDLAKAMTLKNQGTVLIDPAGTEGYLTYQPILETDWTVGSFVPIGDYMDHEEQIMRFFLMTVASAVLIIAVMLLLLKRYVFRPVLALDQDILRISAEGEITYRLPVDQRDPFAILRKSVNGTLEKTQSFFERMEENKSDLAAANDELEASLQQLAANESELRNQHEVLKESRDALGISEKRNRAIVNALPDLVFILDREGVFLDCQVSDESLLLYRRSDFLGKRLAEIMPETIASAGMSAIAMALRVDSLQTFEYSLEMPDGINHFEMRVVKSGSEEVVAITRNITEQKNNHHHIEYLSYHDQLTGLYNRRFFEEEISRLDTARNLPFTMMMLDVNGLKLTNDAFGHLAGDELLKRVAGILKKESRGDDIVARIGGDEFVILLPKTTADETTRIVKRIMLAASVEHIDNVVISVSMGWATKTSTDQMMKDIFTKAEEHMYRKKLAESQSMRNETIKVILRTLNEKNERERIHSDKVSSLSKGIGIAMGLDYDAIKQIETAGLMHDIGKIAIDQKLLNKPGELTSLEYEEIQKHPEVGYQILKSVDAYSPLAESVLSHHEKWDGSGYPRGLQGNAIPLFARIIAVADAYEAMTSDRPYRAGLKKADALKELKAFAGIQFDPEIVEILVGLENGR